MVRATEYNWGPTEIKNVKQNIGGDSDAAYVNLLEFLSLFEGILMQISEETASNLHTLAFSISSRSLQNRDLD